MTEEYRYLSDEELEKMIAQTEKEDLIAPPVYLKEMIMREVRSGEIQEARAAAKRQFALYSIKVMSAAAAAIFCLVAVPANLPGPPLSENTQLEIEHRVEKDMERFKEEEDKIFSEKTGNGIGMEPLLNLFHPVD